MNKALLIGLCLIVAGASAMSPADVKKHTKDSLHVVPLGKTDDKKYNGRSFYEYFFSHHPEHRKYFKGAESFTADDVAKSDRFEKLGNGLLLSVNVLANTYDNEDVFRAFVRETIDRHVSRGLDPALWKAFWGIWEKFLESKGHALTADEKAAWEALGTRFNDEAQQQLAHHGLPHV
uniref:Myoglobin-1 n=1 Tax=Heligmosomoides polygyrus bakeri TaxID=375939 RepID=G3C8V8_HELBE|nr:myoglobin-1 [Heligmosomoides bakeri]